MKVVILAGGFGTRLVEETAILPKPMIEVGGRPLLWHIMKLFSSQGYSEFIVALGYKGSVIKRYFLEYRFLERPLSIDLRRGGVPQVRGELAEDWTVHLIDTGVETMTGGRLKRLAPFLDDTFILTYGDGLADIDLTDLTAFHRAHGKLATVTAVQPQQRFGVLSLAGDKVQAFSEKPAETTHHVNGGFFVLEPGVLDYIDGDATSWERAPCERLAQDGQLRARRHDGYWQCVDTLHELRLLRGLWDRGAAPWKTWQ